MSLASDPTDLLKTEFQGLPLVEVLQKPPGVLLGVSDAAASTLAGLGVKSVFDLALSRIFAAAVQLDDAADNPDNALNRFGAPVTDMVRPGLSGALKITDLRFQPVDILAGIADAAGLQTALDVKTVRDLALYPPYLAAREVLNRVFFPERLTGFDPDSPADLIPKSGEFPTERVQYTALLLDEIRRPDGAPALIDLAGAGFTPLDVALIAAPEFGFSTLGLGALLTFNQSWFMQGVTLGHLLHSMALAPGESTRIAVVDWSRKSSAGQTELIGETEDLSQDTSRNRSISEVTEAVARETQSGFSSSESESTTKQAGASGGFSIGPVGFGASASIAKTSASAESYSTTAGSREVGASMLQQVNDRTHQNAHSARTRRASVVREVSQSEHEEVSTRVITNYNHMHALTVQYYEVLQAYRVETAVVRCDRVVFVPFKLVDFSNEDVLLRFRNALINAALTRAVRDALVNFDTLELKPDQDVYFPSLGTTIKDATATGIVLRRPVLRTAAVPDTAAAGTAAALAAAAPPRETETEPPRPTRPPVSVPALRREVAFSLWAGELVRLASTLGDVQVRRNSESLFVPADVKVVDGEVHAAPGQTLALTFQRRDGTRVSDPQGNPLPLADIARISLTGSNANADVEAVVVLTLSRNGVIFPLALPAVRVVKGSAETSLLAVNAAGADVNLVQHLNDNRLYYSQAVFRNLDAAMIAGLLSAYSITLDGQSLPLVQVAEPKPLRIVGNYLAFKINTDPARDTEWRTFMTERGIALGQAKVDVVPLSSGGIFAEAVLGRFNCAEKLDLTRFWNWQDSPIPIQPSDIAAIQTGTRATLEDVKPGTFSAPIVNITPPAALPDPTGMAGVLAAVQNGNMFRDMSGLSETVKLAQAAITASAAGATAAGSEATKSMKIAVDADTERRRINADLEKAKIGKPLADQNPSVQGAVVNEQDKKNAAKGKTAPAPQGGGAPPKPGGSAGGSSGAGGAAGGGSASTSSGNAALDRIIGNDESLRNFLGLDPNSPAPTPAVTAEGVPLQEWDFIGGGYALYYQETEAGPRELAIGTQIEEIIAIDFWTPTTADDFRPLLLGDRKVRGADFGDLLFALALLPAGSLRALNIAAYASGPHELAFVRDFIFTKSTEGLSSRSEALTPLSLLDVQKLLALNAVAPIDTGNGSVKLADVRKAFPVDGEVRIFNLEAPLSPEFVQAMANFFQVRTTGLVKKPARVRAEVIATTEGEAPILAKKVDLQGDPPGAAVDFFVNLLQQDRALSGAYTAFPRR